MANISFIITKHDIPTFIAKTYVLICVILIAGKAMISTFFHIMDKLFLTAFRAFIYREFPTIFSAEIFVNSKLDFNIFSSFSLITILKIILITQCFMCIRIIYFKVF